MGALFAEGTECLTIDSCRFSRLDGNAILLSGYARNATVNGSDFRFIGGTAVATWGRTDEITDNGRNGFDATAGDFPRFVTISNNLVDTIGLWQKQASAYFQAKAAQNVVRSNIMMPSLMKKAFTIPKKSLRLAEDNIIPQRATGGMIHPLLVAPPSTRR